MSGINKANFHEYAWHFGVLEYIQAVARPNASALGQAAAELLQENFRKFLPLDAIATIPDFEASGLRGSGTVRIWVGVEMHREEHICVLHIREATPFPKGHEDICFTCEDRNGLVILQDELKFSYNGESQIFLAERVA